MLHILERMVKGSTIKCGLPDVIRKETSTHKNRDNKSQQEVRKQFTKTV
jgi:hypothetical protein